MRCGVFAEAAAAHGHGIEEWSLAWGKPPPRPLDEYDAVLVFGGVMHADQDRQHPWLREESMLLQRLLDLRVPLLGVCLGAQLIARAAGAPVGPASEPEVGWSTVELTAAAGDDELFAGLATSFEAFQWHFYTHGIPAGGVELAGSRVCTQAFRLGEAAWGVQFHPEVTLAQIERWTRETPEDLPASADELIAESRAHIDAWNDFGRTLCSNFLAVAEGLSIAA